MDISHPIISHYVDKEKNGFVVIKLYIEIVLNYIEQKDVIQNEDDMMKGKQSLCLLFQGMKRNISSQTDSFGLPNGIPVIN